MPNSDNDPLEVALQSWFQALESGEIPNLNAICGDDESLMEEVRAITDSEQLLIDNLQGRIVGEDEDLPVEVLGEFRLRRAIGKGGMGQVYLAEQVGLGRMVALKVLDQKSMGDPRAQLRFRREAEITAALDHPNIVPIYGVGEDKGFFYIAMKWLTGPGLDKPGLKLSPKRVADIGAAVARCLDQAHSCGVVHRDIKPGNIVLDSERPFVVDFGLARARTDPNLTQEGVVAGTLPYLAPEQIELKTAGHDPRTDIYALGATLYTLCAGVAPFEDEDQRRLARKIILRDPATLPLPFVDRDLETIIFKALEKDPTARFQRARDLAEELERYRDGEAISTRSVGPVGRLVRSIRRRKALAAGLMSLMALVLVFATLWDLNRRESNVRFLAGLDFARVAFAKDQRLTARAFLKDLLARQPDNTEALSLLHDVNARDSYEKLLSFVIDSPSAANSGRLQELVADCEKFQARELDPQIFDLAMVLVDLASDKKDEAKERMKRILATREGGNSRAAQFLARIVNDDLSPIEPHGVSSSADDYVLCAVALRTMERPMSEIKRELNRAMSIAPAQRRAVQLLGTLALDEGDLETARIVFMSMEDSEKVNAVVVRSHAHAALFMGLLQEAEAVLAQIADSDRDPSAFALEGVIRHRLGDFKGFEQKIRQGLERFPGNPKLMRHLVSLLTSQGRQEEARKVLKETRAPYRFGRTAELKRVADMVLAFNAIQLGGGEVPWQLDDATRSSLEKMDRSLDSLLMRTNHPMAAAQGQKLKALVSFQLRGLDDALKHLRLAMDQAPSYTWAHAVFVNLVNNNVLANPDPSRSQTERFALLKEATEVVARMLKEEGKGECPAPTESFDSASMRLVYFTQALGNVPAFLEAARQALPRCPESAELLQSIIDRYDN